jgi:hypothetical protein
MSMYIGQNCGPQKLINGLLLNNVWETHMSTTPHHLHTHDERLRGQFLTIQVGPQGWTLSPGSIVHPFVHQGVNTLGLKLETESELCDLIKRCKQTTISPLFFWTDVDPDFCYLRMHFWQVNKTFVKFVNKVKDDDFLISFITSAKQLKALPARWNLEPGIFAPKHLAKKLAFFCSNQC